MSNSARRAETKRTLDDVTRAFPERLGGHIETLIKTEGRGGPIARQYRPDIKELDITPDEQADPIGDHAHSPIKGIVHRHKGRVLLKVASVCAVNCRFCFRKNMLGTPEETLNWREMDEALAYIESHPEISEVILTGGDPLVLSPKRLDYILGRLDKMNNINMLRIHSRVPVAAPDKMTDAVLNSLTREKPLYLVLHINHASEITQKTEQVLQGLHRSGIVLLSQSVLLKGVNDSVEALDSLFHKLLSLRVKPYYLHHPDLVSGTSHFRVSIEKGQELMRALRKQATGMAIPSYVLDIPGGYGKVPLENASIEKQAGGYIVTDPQGRKHHYAG